MNNITNVSQELVPSSRAQLINNVKQWVLIDSQLKIITEKTKKLRDMKHETTDQLYKYMADNKINSNITISDGELRFYEKRESTPLSFGYIERCLGNILSDKTQIEFIIQYLKDNRETTTTADIKRIYKKL